MLDTPKVFSDHIVNPLIGSDLIALNSGLLSLAIDTMVYYELT